MASKKRKAVLIETRILSDDSHSEMRIEFPNQEEMDKYLSDKHKRQEEKRKAFHSRVAELIQENNNSDRISLADCAKKWSKPSEQDVRESIDSLEPTWPQADMSALHGLTATGKPPMEYEAGHWEAITKQALAEEEDNLVCASDEAETYVISQLAPVQWLEDRMRALHVIKPLAAKISFQLGREAAMSDGEAMWVRCVHLYNGFLKTLWEAHTFALAPKAAGAKKSSSKSSNQHGEKPRKRRRLSPTAGCESQDSSSSSNGK